MPAVLREGKYRKSPSTAAHIYINPSWRFQESPRCFGIKRFKTLKLLPKIEGATERCKNQTNPCRPKKGPTKSGATAPLMSTSSY